MQQFKKFLRLEVAENHESKEKVDKDELLNKLKKEKRGGIKAPFRILVRFSSNQFGVVASLLIAAINAFTTIVGASLILPEAIGVFLAIVLSGSYFILLVNPKLQEKYPLRVRTLIFMFFVASLYTSFFAIYEQVTEPVKTLKEQAFDRPKEKHLNYLFRLKDIIERGSSTFSIDYINELTLEQEKLSTLEERESKNQTIHDNLIQQGLLQQASVYRNKVSALEPKIEMANNNIRNIKKNQDYLSQKKIKKINDDISVYIDEAISYRPPNKKGDPNADFDPSQITPDNVFDHIWLFVVETFIGFFGKDETNRNNDLQDQLDKYLGSAKKVHEEALTLSYKSPQKNTISGMIPNEDDYKLTPYFLIPLDLFGSSQTRPKIFMGFALLVAIFLETLPPLFGYLRISDDKDYLTKEEIEKIGLLKTKLYSAMISGGIVDPLEQYVFLINFFFLIDHKEKALFIPVNNLTNDSNQTINKEKYRVANELFISLLSNSKNQILKRDKQNTNKGDQDFIPFTDTNSYEIFIEYFLDVTNFRLKDGVFALADFGLEYEGHLEDFVSDLMDKYPFKSNK